MRRRVLETCREYRVIPFAELPTVTEMDGTEREATDADLMQFDIHVFDRGANQVQALCNGYWDPDLEAGINAQGETWPGTLLAGRKGLYRKARLELVEASLKGYKGGENGGRRRLMADKRPEEFETRSRDLETDEEVITPAQELTEGERLSRAFPRIMGDG